MRSLTDTIKAHEERLALYDLSPTSKVLAQDTLYHLKSIDTKKPCPIYGGLAVKSCDVCQECLAKLAWNEGDV